MIIAKYKIVEACRKMMLIPHILRFIFSPDDQFRVVLELQNGDEHSDYINASYINVRVYLTLKCKGL